MNKWHAAYMTCDGPEWVLQFDDALLNAHYNTMSTSTCMKATGEHVFAVDEACCAGCRLLVLSHGDLTLAHLQALVPGSLGTLKQPLLQVCFNATQNSAHVVHIRSDSRQRYLMHQSMPILGRLLQATCAIMRCNHVSL